MRLASAMLLFALTMAGADREVAITIDDLPRGGDGGGRTLNALRQMTTQLMQPFIAGKIPVIGFVNSGRVPGLRDTELREILQIWLNAGAELGNHSYSHPDLNTVPLADFKTDVIKGENVVADLLAAQGRKLEFFRHPYLHTGATREAKEGLATFLREHHYREAPVTLDNSDYLFAAAYTQAELRDRARREYVPYMESVVAFFEQRSVEVFGREIPQILLIHASQLNADLMPDFLGMFRSRGYKFISLREALKDSAYSSPEDYVGRGGFSWLHRWSKTKGMVPKGEPEAPAWLPGPR